MKKAIVVGGTTGIGNGVAEVLLKNNYEVIVTGVERNVVSEINTRNDSNYKAVFLDCINESVSTTLNSLIEGLGGLDLLVFSAGIGNLNKNLGFKVENNANKLNVLAFTEVVDWTYRFFEKQGFGHLVAVTSFSGLFGCRVAPAYHAAKAYQISYLEGFRQKSKKSGLPIYITDARPGFVDTPMTEGKKMFWTASATTAANQIFSLIRRKKNVGYVTKRWGIPAALMKAMPRLVRNRI